MSMRTLFPLNGCASLLPQMTGSPAAGLITSALPQPLPQPMRARSLTPLFQAALRRSQQCGFKDPIPLMSEPRAEA